MNSRLNFRTSNSLFLIGRLLCALLFTAPLMAEEKPDYEGPYAKLYGGFNLALDTDFEGSSSELFPSGEGSLDAGPVIGIAGGYRFSRNFAAELEYAYRSNDIDSIDSSSSGQNLVSGGDLASVAIMANGYYFFDFNEDWSPYVGLGIGMLQEIDADVELLGRGAQDDLEDEALAWQAMVGAEVPLDESVRVFGEGRFFSAPGPDLSNGNGSYDLDYDNFSLVVGIGYQF